MQTRKLKFQGQKSCLKAIWPGNEIYYSEKKLDVGILRKKHQELIKYNRMILRSQQRFTKEKHDAFSEKVNKIALSANLDTT